MNEGDLTIEQRLFLVEHAIERLQDFGRGPYLGICVNAGIDTKDHPHWDDEMVALAKVTRHA